MTATLESQLARAKARLDEEKQAALLTARADFPELQMLNLEQLKRLYDMYVADGHTNDHLATFRSRQAFLYWAVTPPIREVFNEDRRVREAMDEYRAHFA